jgi:hypothetical protein
MRFHHLVLPVALVLAACSTPAQPSGSASASATPMATSAFKGTVSVKRDGTPLRVGPQFHDNDYGYQRDFVFGAYSVEEMKLMGADEVGLVWSDGNLADNSSNIKLRLTFKDQILEIQGVPGKPNTALMPGACTKEMSADKGTLVRYTYEGKMINNGTDGKPTAESYAVELTNLDVTRK